jgi:beta-lactam-binding protein with PASTA domain
MRNTLGATLDLRRTAVRRYAIVLGIGLLVLGAYAISQLARVPAATGRYGEAYVTLTNDGFRVTAFDGAGRVVKNPHDLAVVVSQDPSPGAIRSFRSTVTVHIKPPSATVTVPDVVGMHVSAAAHALHDAGLVLNTGGFIANDGTVTATSPVAGRVVAFGSTVGYAVASQ